MTFFEQHDAIGIELLYRYGGMLRLRIVLPRDELKFVDEQASYRQIIRIVGQSDECHVELTTAQALEQALGQVFAQMQPQSRIAAAQRRQQAGQQERRNGWDHAE